MQKHIKIVSIIIATLIFGVVVMFFVKNRNIVHAEPIHIAVINASKIKTKSRAFQKFEESVLKQTADLRGRILEKENAFRLEYEALQKQIQNKKSKKDDVDRLKNAFQKKITAYEVELQTEKEGLFNDMAKGRDGLEKKLLFVIENIAQRHHFNLVLNSFVDDKKLVMYANKGFDITNMVIEELDQAIEK